jgi:hypothetical protein
MSVAREEEQKRPASSVNRGPDAKSSGRLQDALPVLKSHLKSLQTLQHGAMQRLFKDQTESNSSITFRVQNDSPPTTSGSSHPECN